MRKSTICYILCAVLLIVCCNSSCKQGGDPIYTPVSVLAKAFMEDEDVREMFIEVAHAIIDLPVKSIPSHFTGYESDEEVEKYCFGEDTAAKIGSLRELFPGYSDKYSLGVGRDIKADRNSVEFAILLRHENFVGEVRHAEDQYSEFLIYSPDDLSDLEMYGYKKIDENWYSRFMPVI